MTDDTSSAKATWATSTPPVSLENVWDRPSYGRDGTNPDGSGPGRWARFYTRPR